MTTFLIYLAAMLVAGAGGAFAAGLFSPAIALVWSILWGIFCGVCGAAAADQIR